MTATPTDPNEHGAPYNPPTPVPVNTVDPNLQSYIQVCSWGDYDSVNGVCLHKDNTVSRYNNDYMSWEMPSNVTNGLVAIYQQDGAGNWADVAHYGSALSGTHGSHYSDKIDNIMRNVPLGVCGGWVRVGLLDDQQQLVKSSDIYFGC
jgi:hypothetical protein